jgi:hypothetical protein
MTEPPTVPGADLIVRRLREHGVREVFGYPGGQLTPIYDAIYREPALRHFLARHEQAACFMADGYARATGRTGVCLAVCGPGVFNAATPLSSAYTDSVPVLLISGQVPGAGRGLRSGYYHENDQLSACATFTKARFRADRAEQIPSRLFPCSIRPGPRPSPAGRGRSSTRSPWMSCGPRHPSSPGRRFPRSRAPGWTPRTRKSSRWCGAWPAGKDRSSLPAAAVTTPTSHRS